MLDLGRRCGIAIALLAGIVAADPAAAHGRPHDLADVDVSVDAGTLSIQLDAPLDSLLGFGHAPKTDAQKRAAADLLLRVGKGDQLFHPDAGAGCTLTAAEIVAPSIQPRAAGAKPLDPKDHGVFNASYEFECRSPDRLYKIGIQLFDAFARLQTVDVRVAGPGGQSRHKLKRATADPEVPVRR